MKPMFNPSLMCMNLMALKEQMEVINRRASLVHIDIMDGHFVKNLTLSPFFVESIRSACKVPIDCHLMVTNPEDFVETLVAAGADYIVPHAETINIQAFKIIDSIHSKGCKAGVAFNPATPVSVILPYIARLDKITVMSVEPGFAGQKFVPEVLPKIRELKKLKEKNGYNYFIEIDGACNANTFKDLHEAGAEAYVAGSTGLFKNDPDLNKAWDIMLRDFSLATGYKGDK